jgi:hypothetical protein
MNNVSYQPSGAEIAIAQAWTTPNGYGTVLTPWTLDTDSLTITCPTSGGNVTFGFGRGVFASVPSPGGSLTGAGAATPAATVTASPITATSAATTVAGLSPVLLIGIAVGAWYFFFRKK